MTTLRTLLAALPSLIAGLALVDLLVPARRPTDWLLKLFMGFGLGLGITSCLDFFWMLLFSPANLGYRWAEAVLAVGLVGAAVLRKSRLVVLRRVDLHRPTWPAILLTVLLTVVALLGLYSLWGGAIIRPYGNFDAYATWNLRARSLMLTNPQTWMSAFSPLLSWKAHADYPLFWPLTILRSWQALGAEWPQAGQTLTISFGLATAGLMFSALLRFRGLAQAALGTILLLGMPWFLTYHTFQQADGPLAFFYLLVIVLLFMDEHNPRAAVLALAGLGTGLAAWMKNDGEIFLVAVIFYLLLRRLRRPWAKSLLRLAPFAAGLLLPLATILIFKIRLAPPGDIIGDQTLAQMVAKVADPSRWELILVTIAAALPSLGGWNWLMAAALPLYALCAGRAPGGRGFWLWLIPGVTLLGYIGVYLITPHDLAWHMRYSLSRLLFHLLLPSIFLIFVLVKNPGQIILRSDKLRAKLAEPAGRPS